MTGVYEGNEPYIFISYAHKDKDIVMPIIEGLKLRGFRVWYDGGITAGSDWGEYLAQHIQGCRCFMPFLSKNFLASENCKRELEFAASKLLTIAPVYLKNCPLPAKYEMDLIRTQAVFRYKFRSDGSFLDHLCAAPAVLQCKEGVDPEELNRALQQTEERRPSQTTSPTPKPTASTPQTTSSKKSGCCGVWFWLIVIMAVAGWCLYNWLCYAEDNLAFSIQSKYQDATEYMTYLDLEVENGSLLDVLEIKGQLKIYNADDLCLLSMDYTLTSETQANRSTIYDLDFEESDTRHFEELYDADLEDLKVTFQLSSVIYEGYKEKEYDKADIRVLCEVVPEDQREESDSGPAPEEDNVLENDSDTSTDQVDAGVRRTFDDALTLFREMDIHSETATEDVALVAEKLDEIWYVVEWSEVLREDMYQEAQNYATYGEYEKAYILYTWLTLVDYKDSATQANLCYNMYANAA